MKRGLLLFILLFLVIFGPKVSGWLDVVSITSVIAVLTHVVMLNGGHIPGGTKRKTLLMLLAFVALLIFAMLHFAFRLDANPYQVLRFGRVVVNFLGVVALVSMYYRLFGSRTPDVLSRHVFHCLVIHGLIMLAMFCSAPFRHTIVDRVVQADPDSRTYAAKESGYRVSGLTDSWDALSGLESFGLLMLPVLATRQTSFSRVYGILASLILLFAVAISGRTGFVTLALLLPVALLFSDLRRFHVPLMSFAMLLAILVLMLAGPMRERVDQAVYNSSLSRTLAIFGVASSSHHAESLEATFEGIREHYFLPEDPRVLLLGTGGSGRDGWDYVPADNGLILNLHNLGVMSFLLIYGSFFWMLTNGLAVRRQAPAVAGFCILAVLLILLIDTKVLYVFARNGFSVMMVFVVMAWWELDGGRRLWQHVSASQPVEFTVAS